MPDANRGRSPAEPVTPHVVHLAKSSKGALIWSGNRGCGDARYPSVLRVDVGDPDAYLGDTAGRSVLVVPRVHKLDGFTAEALAVAARSGMFGFRVVG